MENLLRKRGVRLALLFVIVSAALVFAYWLRDVFAPLLFSALLAYILNPIVTGLCTLRLGGVRFRRSSSVSLVLLTLMVILGGLIALVGYQVWRWGSNIYSDLRGEPTIAAEIIPNPAEHPMHLLRTNPDGVRYFDLNQNNERDEGYIRDGLRALKELEVQFPVLANLHTFVQAQIDAKSGLLSPEKLSGSLKVLGNYLFEDGEDSGGMSFFQYFSWLVLCPFYMFFLMLHWEQIIESIRRHLPGRYRPLIERICSRIDRIISSFLRGRLIICVLKGLLTGLGLWLFGVNYGFLIGFASGFLSLIPVVGVPSAAIPALMLSWFEHESVWRIVGIASLFIAMEGLDGFVLVPLLLGSELGLSPLTVLVTLLIFGKLFGVIGVLLSIPLAAISKILGEEFLMPLIREFAEEPPDPPRKPSP